MAWEDSLSIELAEEWTRLQQRLSDLITDLNSLAEGQVSVGGITAERVFWWHSQEMLNIDSFKRNAYMDLNLWQGIQMGWDVEEIRGRVNRARTLAQRGQQLVSGLEIRPEVEPERDEDDEFFTPAVMIGMGIIGLLVIVAISR